jgi:hypothetical protein
MKLSAQPNSIANERATTLKINPKTPCEGAQLFDRERERKRKREKERRKRRS